MRKLHVVGVSEDGGTLVLADAPDAPGAYTAPVEDRLRAALRRPVRRTSGAGRGSLTPREIQARLRAGAELADVAAEAGLPPERLEAYAAPVLSERARVLEDARAARMSRPQLGPSAVPLAVAVGQRLRALLGGPPEAVRWSASRAEDASWTVQFSYAADGATGTAAWRWDRSAHSLTPLNRAAAELGHVPRHADRPVPEQATAARAGGAAPVGDAAGTSPAAAARAPGPAAGQVAVPVPAAPAAAVSAPIRAPAPHPVAAANAGPVSAVAPSAQTAAQAGPGTTGPHRADGTQGPSRVEDLQVDAAQAPTVAVLTPPVAAPVSDPATGSPAQAAAQVPPSVEVPAAEAPAAEAPPVPALPAKPVPPRESAKPRSRSARRAAVPTWADVLLGTTPSEQRETQSPDPGAATG